MPQVEEISGFHIEDLAVGQSASYARTVTEADIVLFAGVSGDTNPMHLNEEFAKRTRFKGRIAHGMLSAALISTVLGTKMPGPGSIYLNQTLKFRAPVKAGDTVVARATVSAIVPEKRLVTLTTTCHVGDTLVVEGEAVVMAPSRNKPA